MRQAILLLLLFAAPLLADTEMYPFSSEKPRPKPKPVSASQVAAGAGGTAHVASGVIMIDPVKRAQDLVEVFNTLQKAKAGPNITFLLTNGEKISGVMNITVTSGGTILIFKQDVPSGTRFVAAPVEQIQTVEL